MAVLRDASLIFLSITAFVLSLIPLAVFGGMVYGLWWLRRHENLPNWLRLSNAYVKLAQAYIELGVAAVTRPILAIGSAWATARGWRSAVGEMLGGGRR